MAAESKEGGFKKSHPSPPRVRYTVLFEKRVGIRFKITLEDAIASPAALFCGTGGVAATDENDGVGIGVESCSVGWMSWGDNTQRTRRDFLYVPFLRGTKTVLFDSVFYFVIVPKSPLVPYRYFAYREKNRLVVL